MPVSVPCEGLIPESAQSPYVPVIKYLHGNTKYVKGIPKSCKKKGIVSLVNDHTIHKRVYELEGGDPSETYLLIPQAGSSLSLTGGYLYMTIRRHQYPLFSISVDINTSRNNVLRLSFSNLFTETKLSGRWLQIPADFLGKEWCMLCLDLRSLVHGYTSYTFQSVRGVVLGGGLALREMVSSDKEYEHDNCPSSMVLQAIKKNWMWVFYNEDELGGQQQQIVSEPIAESKDTEDDQMPFVEENMENVVPLSKNVRASMNQPLSNPPVKCVVDWEVENEFEHEQARRMQKRVPRPMSVAKPEPLQRGVPLHSVHTPVMLHPSSDENISEEHLFSLRGVIGFNPTCYPNVQYLNGLNSTKHVLFAADNVIVFMEVSSKEQVLLSGHTAMVTSIAVSPDKKILASCQGEAGNSCILLWDISQIMSGHFHMQNKLVFHHRDTRSLSFSPDNRLLVAVGEDTRSRTVIGVWDMASAFANVPPAGTISTVDQTNGIVAKQVSEFPISRIAFWPYPGPYRLLSCGKESIRTYRISRGHLPGVSIRTHDMTRGHSYTALSFEPKFGAVDVYQKRAMVCSSLGAVLQVNLDTSTLECIYQVDSEPLTSVVHTGGYCLTANQSGLVTVWHLDFSQFLLQVTVKSSPKPSSSMGIDALAVPQLFVSEDGHSVLVGSGNGTIGYLDILSAQYCTLHRSHVGNITCLAVDPHHQRSHVATGSEDGHIRVWSVYAIPNTSLAHTTHDHGIFPYTSSLPSPTQRGAFGTPALPSSSPHPSLFKLFYEFQCTTPDEVVTCLCYSPSRSSHVLVSGFSSGIVRIRDMRDPDVAYDMRQHPGSVVSLAFSPDSSRLFSADSRGTVCVYDAEEQYHPIALLETSPMIPTYCTSATTQNSTASAPTHKTEIPPVFLSEGCDILAVGSGLDPVLVVRSPEDASILHIYDYSTMSRRAIVRTRGYSPDDSPDTPSRVTILRFSIRSVEVDGSRGEELLVWDNRGELTTYSLQTGHMIHSWGTMFVDPCFPGDSKKHSSMVVSPGGAYSCISNENELTIVDLSAPSSLGASVAHGSREYICGGSTIPIHPINGTVFLTNYALCNSPFSSSNHHNRNHEYSNTHTHIHSLAGDKLRVDVDGGKGELVSLTHIVIATGSCLWMGMFGGRESESLLHYSLNRQLAPPESPRSMHLQSGTHAHAHAQAQAHAQRPHHGDGGMEDNLDGAAEGAYDAQGHGNQSQVHGRRISLPGAEDMVAIVNAQYLCSRDPFPLANPSSYLRPTASDSGWVEESKSVSNAPAPVPASYNGTLVGYNSEARNNIVWSPDSGFFAYSSGRTVIIQWLHPSPASASKSVSSRHNSGMHPMEQELLCALQSDVSCLGLSTDGRFLVSAEGSPSSLDSDNPSCLSLWNMQLRQYLPLQCPADFPGHTSGVQCVAIGHDATLLVSVGIWNPYVSEQVIVCVWNIRSQKLVSYAFVNEPIYAICFGEKSSTTNGGGSKQFYSVGKSVLQWSIETGPTSLGNVETVLQYDVLHGVESDNTTQRPSSNIGAGGQMPDSKKEPDESGMIFTSICVGNVMNQPVLFVGTSAGHLLMFDLVEKVQPNCLSIADAEIDLLQFVLPKSSSSLLEPLGSYLVVGTNSGTVLFLQPSVAADALQSPQANITLRDFGKCELDGSVTAGVFHPTFLTGIVGTSAGTVWFVDHGMSHLPSTKDSDKQIRLVSSHSAFVNQVVFTGNEKHVLSCSSDGSIRLFDLMVGQQVMQFQVHHEICICVCVHPRLPFCVAGYSDGSIRFIDLESQTLSGKLRVSRNPVTCLEFWGRNTTASGSDCVLVGTVEGRVWLVDIQKKVPLAVYDVHRGARIECLAVSRESSHWLATDSDSRLSVWDNDQAICVVHVSSQYEHSYVAPNSHTGFIAPTVASFVPGQPQMILCSAPTISSDAKLLLFNFQTSEWVKSIPVSPHIPVSISVSPCGSRVATGNQDGVVVMYPLIKNPSHSASPLPLSEDGAVVFVHNDLVNSVNFSPSGKMIVSGGHSQFHFISLY